LGVQLQLPSDGLIIRRVRSSLVKQSKASVVVVVVVKTPTLSA